MKAALGVKITATDLDKAISGSRLMICGPDEDEDDLKDEVMSDLTNLLSSVDRSGRGVSVQASTLGSLEALLEFLKVSKIPVASIGLGPVHKRDIMQAATMVEKAKELACVLCFDVTVDKDAEKIAEEYGIKIFKGPHQSSYLSPSFLLCTQRTSSTICLMPSLLITPKCSRPNERMPPLRPFGRAG